MLFSTFRMLESDCKQIEDDLDYIRSEAYTLDYKIIRYEDIALSPEDSARRIYDAFDFPYIDDVTEWIKLSTANVSKKAAAKAWDIKRNSQTVPFQWSNTLTPDILTMVEMSCSRVMSMLGYKSVSHILFQKKKPQLTAEEVLDDLDKSLDGVWLR